MKPSESARKGKARKPISLMQPLCKAVNERYKAKAHEEMQRAPYTIKRKTP